MKPKLPLTRPHFESDELSEIQRVLDSGWVSKGPKAREFEEAASRYLGVEHAIAVNNCTAALHLSLLALGIKAGDEVLVADYTFPATGHAVLYCGAKPVFVDVDLGTYNIDPAAIEGRITERTKAIIPVHTFGQPADMSPILETAERHGLKVIEDAACAFGAKYKGRHAGTISDIGCFSFHARKGITTGEGGMIVTSNKELADRMRHLSVFGMTSAWEREKGDGFTIPEFTDVGYNYKMSDILAAVGVAQLRKLDSIIERKRALASHWDEGLMGVDGIEPPQTVGGAVHIYQSYVAMLDKGIDRNGLIEALAEKGVQCQIGTYASHIQPVYGADYACPNSLEVFNRALALPMYTDLNEEDIDAALIEIERALEELR